MLLGIKRYSITSPYASTCKCIERFSDGACKEADVYTAEWGLVEVTPATLLSSLRCCVEKKALLVGKCLHSQIVECGLEQNSSLDKILIQVYKHCGALDDAVALFDTLFKRNVGMFNLLLQEYARQGRGETADALFHQMQQEGLLPNKISHVSILSVCATQRTLSKGKRIHSMILWSCGFDRDAVVCTALMNMYGKCGCVDESQKLFDRKVNRDVVFWTAMISIYAKHGRSLEALKVFDQMQQDETRPNEATLVSVLKACACLGCMTKGQIIHHWIYENEFELHVLGGNVLIHLYSKCGSMEDAERTFQLTSKKDVATWNAIISLYTSYDYIVEAISHFVKMQESGIIPNSITFISILPTCASNTMLVVGEWLHSLILDLDLESDIMVCNALLTMYGKCNCLGRVQDLFSEIPSQGAVSWNSLISTYIQHNKGEETLKQVRRMQHEGFFPDKITFLLVLALCANHGMLSVGKQVHVAILNDQLETDLAVGNALNNMYSKCGSLEDAWRTLDNMHARDILSYNPIIEMLSDQGNAKRAFQIFEQLLQEALLPGKVTFTSMLSVCANLEILDAGRRVHAFIGNCGLGSDTVIQNALLSMYGKIGNWSDAHAVFEAALERDQISWNTLLTAYACNGFGHKAVQMFNQMQMEGELPDKVTFLAIMLACGHLPSLQNGKRLHAYISGSELCKDVVVRNALMRMYGKCGSVKDAQDIFNEVINNNGSRTTWNVMISVYAHQGQGMHALQLFHRMQQCGEIANPFSFVSAIFACTSQIAITEGFFLHARLQYSAIERVIAVENALMNMYGKWGNTIAAQKVFDNMQVHDVISWTTIIAMYAQHGHIQHALNYYKRMQSKGILPNDVTLLSILNGYSHTGLVDPCLGFLWHSGSALAIPDHFVSIIDLLVRAGQLKEAEELIKVMPFEPNVASYMTLLAGCRHLVDMECGQFAAKKVLELDPRNSAARIMLSNVYVAGGREDVTKTMKLV